VKYPIYMPNSTRTFRLFVSSIFSDLVAERNALRTRVYPRLAALYKAHSASFQAVDLPENVHIFVSCLPGLCPEALQARLPSEQLLELDPMPQNEAEALLDRWLAEAGRRLQFEQRQMRIKGGSVMCVALNPAGDVLLSGTISRAIQKWKSGDHKPSENTRLYGGGVFKVVFLPDDNRALICSDDQSGGRYDLRLWDVDN
jgi:hypothetical protein